MGRKFGRIDYRLNIKLIENESYEAFMHFLDKVKYPQKLVFHKISWALSEKCIDNFNKLHEMFALFEFDEKLLTTSDDVSMRMHMFRGWNINTNKIKYISVLPIPKHWPHFEKIGRLNISLVQKVSVLSTIEVPVEELIIDNLKILALLLSPDFQLSPYVHCLPKV